jgi:hypothetical protein
VAFATVPVKTTPETITNAVQFVKKHISVIGITRRKPNSSQLNLKARTTTLLTGDDEMTFEEIYPRYAFSELVRWGLAAGKVVIRFRNWRHTIEERRQSGNLGPAH